MHPIMLQLTVLSVSPAWYSPSSGGSPSASLWQPSWLPSEQPDAPAPAAEAVLLYERSFASSSESLAKLPTGNPF